MADNNQPVIKTPDLSQLGGDFPSPPDEFNIDNDGLLQWAVDCLIHRRRQLNLLDDSKAQHVKPIQAGLTAIRKTYREVEEHLEEDVAILNQAIAEYYVAKKQKLIDEYQKLGKLKRLTKSQTSALTDLDSQISEPLQGEGGKIGLRQRTEYNVIDWKKVPPKYLKLDTAAVRADLKFSKSIPGIEIEHPYGLAVYLQDDSDA